MTAFGGGSLPNSVDAFHIHNIERINGRLCIDASVQFFYEESCQLFNPLQLDILKIKDLLVNIEFDFRHNLALLSARVF
jgi:hypothetical protein